MSPLPKAQRAVMFLLRKLWLNLELLTLRGYPGKILSLFSIAGISAPSCQAHTGHQKITSSCWTNPFSAAKLVLMPNTMHYDIENLLTYY